FDHPVAFVHPNLGSPGSDHHSATDLLLIFDRLGFYPLVLGFACHFYPLFLLVLLLSLVLLSVFLFLVRVCLFLLLPLFFFFLLSFCLLLFPGFSLVSLVLDRKCLVPHSFPGPAVAVQAPYL